MKQCRNNEEKLTLIQTNGDLKWLTLGKQNHNKSGNQKSTENCQNKSNKIQRLTGTWLNSLSEKLVHELTVFHIQNVDNSIPMYFCRSMQQQNGQ